MESSNSGQERSETVSRYLSDGADDELLRQAFIESGDFLLTVDDRVQARFRVEDFDKIFHGAHEEEPLDVILNDIARLKQGPLA